MIFYLVCVLTMGYLHQLTSVDKENPLKGSFEKTLDIKKPALSWCLFLELVPRRGIEDTA